MKKMLREKKYFTDNFGMLLSKYEGRTLVIKDKAVQADFEEFGPAYSFAVKNFEPETYIIQKCSKEELDKVIFNYSVWRV